MRTALTKIIRVLFREKQLNTICRWRMKIAHMTESLIYFKEQTNTVFNSKRNNLLKRCCNFAYDGICEASQRNCSVSFCASRVKQATFFFECYEFSSIFSLHINQTCQINRKYYMHTKDTELEGDKLFKDTNMVSSVKIYTSLAA